MSYRIEISETAPDGWDERVKSVPEGTIYQTTMWAEYIKNCLEGKCFYMTIKNNGNIEGLLLLELCSLYSKNTCHNPYTKIVFLFKKFLKTVRWMYGPIILNKKNKVVIMAHILDGVDEFASRFGVYSISHATSPMHGEDNSDLENLFKRHFYTISAQGTFLIDLNLPEKTVWGKIKKSARKNIKKTSVSIQIEQLNSEGKIREYALLASKDKKLKTSITFRNCLRAWNIFRKGSNIEILLAKHREKYVSGITILSFNGILTEAGIARSRYEKLRKIYPQDSIKWSVIQFGLSTNKRVYDLMGVKMFSTTSKDAGILRYKKKWGGSLQTFNIYKKEFSETNVRLRRAIIKANDLHKNLSARARRL